MFLWLAALENMRIVVGTLKSVDGAIQVKALVLGCYNRESVEFPVNTLSSKFPYLSSL